MLIRPDGSIALAAKWRGRRAPAAMTDNDGCRDLVTGADQTSDLVQVRAFVISGWERDWRSFGTAFITTVEG